MAGGLVALEEHQGPVAEAATRAIPALPSDFNGDGVQDLAVAAPWDAMSSGDTPGAVHVFYGDNGVADRLPNQYLRRATPGLGALLPRYSGLFGYQLASADFDRDGYADLVASVPGYDEPGAEPPRVNAGAVVVIHGTAHGLDPLGSPRARVWSQDSAGVQGASEDDDAFGSALAAGDFDADGYADLAVGAEGETLGAGDKDHGALRVLYGSASGVTARDQSWTQDSPGVLDVAERGDYAARSLTAGDFDGDGADDLVMGVAQEGVNGYSNAGAVNVLYGQARVGLTAVGDQFVSQASSGVPGATESNDEFGDALTVGDFNGDDRDDLVIGAPSEDIGVGGDEAGSATVIYGSRTGLDRSTSRALTMHALPLDPTEGEQTSRMMFGDSLAAGDVDGDGYDELAVGSPFWGSFDGRVDVIRGSASGLDAASGRRLTTASFSTPGYVAGGENFGSALAFGEFDATPGADLAIGASRANVRVNGTTIVQAGAARIVYARDGALTASASRLLHQEVAGVGGAAAKYEQFGFNFPGSGDTW